MALDSNTSHYAANTLIVTSDNTAGPVLSPLRKEQIVQSDRQAAAFSAGLFCGAPYLAGRADVGHDGVFAGDVAG